MPQNSLNILILALSKSILTNKRPQLKYEIYISKENLEPLLVGRNIISETLKVTTPGKLAQMV